MKSSANHSMRRLGAILGPVVLAAVSQTACAQSGQHTQAQSLVQGAVRGPVAQVRIIDRDTGRELPVYRYRGDYWVAGQPGARYGVSILGQAQPLGGRIEAVISIDGVNVITGQTASWRQTGYVLSTRQWHTITGWRKNDREVAAFHFTALPHSYAARTGRPDNVGVIGVALYREKPVPQITRPWRETPPIAEEAGREGTWPQDRAANGAAAESMQRAPAPTSKSALPAGPLQDSERLGTGHGPREHSSVTYTTFERRSRNPEQIVTIRYDSHENLVSMGVISRQVPLQLVRPQPFPETLPRQYVPDPPNW